MNPFILFNVLITTSIAVWAIIAVVYVYPWLREKPWYQAVLPLILLHAFRFVPMTAFGPGQMQDDLPDAARAVAGSGGVNLVALEYARQLEKIKFSGVPVLQDGRMGQYRIHSVPQSAANSASGVCTGGGCTGGLQ